VESVLPGLVAIIFGRPGDNLDRNSDRNTLSHCVHMAVEGKMRRKVMGVGIVILVDSAVVLLDSYR
jgi:hypothetical protein